MTTFLSLHGIEKILLRKPEAGTAEVRRDYEVFEIMAVDANGSEIIINFYSKNEKHNIINEVDHE